MLLKKVWTYECLFHHNCEHSLSIGTNFNFQTIRYNGLSVLGVFLSWPHDFSNVAINGRKLCRKHICKRSGFQNKMVRKLSWQQIGSKEGPPLSFTPSFGLINLASIFLGWLDLRWLHIVNRARC